LNEPEGSQRLFTIFKQFCETHPNFPYNETREEIMKIAQELGLS